MADIASLVIKADATDIKQLNKSLDALSKRSDKTERETRKLNKGFASMGSVIRSLTPITAGLTAALSISKVISDAVRVTKQFESAIADLSAITGATGKDLSFLSDASRELGKTTTLSATQAAEAFKLIASAKPDLLSNVEALKMVTKEAVTLAEAAGTTLPEAANTLGSSLNQFGAEADQAARFINVLAAGSKMGASSIADVSLAMKNAGTTAAAAGLSFEETNAAIQSLSTVAIKGGEAGTALRNVILKLQKEGVEKLDPAVVGLTGALENLASENRSTTELMKLFGMENVNAAQALLTQVDGIKDLTKALTGTNTAYDQAKTKNDTLEGSLKQLNSVYEETGLIIGERINPLLRELVEFATEALEAINELLGRKTDEGQERYKKMLEAENTEFAKQQALVEDLIKTIEMLNKAYMADGELSEIEEKGLARFNKELTKAKERLEELTPKMDTHVALFNKQAKATAKVVKENNNLDKSEKDLGKTTNNNNSVFAKYYSSLQKQWKTVEEYNKSLKDQINISQAVGIEKEYAIARARLNTEVLDEETKELIRQNFELQKQKELTKAAPSETKKTTDQMKSNMDEFYNQMQNDFIDGFVDQLFDAEQEWDDFLEGMLADWGKTMMKMEMKSWLTEGKSYYFGDSTSSASSAAGNYMNQSGSFDWVPVIGWIARAFMANKARTGSGAWRGSYTKDAQFADPLDGGFFGSGFSKAYGREIDKLMGADEPTKFHAFSADVDQYGFSNKGRNYAGYTTFGDIEVRTDRASGKHGQMTREEAQRLAQDAAATIDALEMINQYVLKYEKPSEEVMQSIKSGIAGISTQATKSPESIEQFFKDYLGVVASNVGGDLSKIIETTNGDFGKLMESIVGHYDTKAQVEAEAEAERQRLEKERQAQIAREQAALQRLYEQTSGFIDNYLFSLKDHSTVINEINSKYGVVVETEEQFNELMKTLDNMTEGEMKAFLKNNKDLVKDLNKLGGAIEKVEEEAEEAAKTALGLAEAFSAAVQGLGATKKALVDLYDPEGEAGRLESKWSIKLSNLNTTLANMGLGHLQVSGSSVNAIAEELDTILSFADGMAGIGAIDTAQITAIGDFVDEFTYDAGRYNSLTKESGESADIASEGVSKFNSELEDLNEELLDLPIAQVLIDIQGLRRSILQDKIGFGFKPNYNKQISVLKGKLSPTGTESDVEIYDKIRQATVDKYNAEIAAIQEAENARISQLQEEQGYFQSIQQYVKDLRLSELSPLLQPQRTQEAGQSFHALANAAMSGDMVALSQLQGSAQTYLENARTQYASGGQYSAIFETVESILNQFGNQADYTAYESAQLELDRRIENIQAAALSELEQLDHNVATLEAALNETFADTLASLTNITEAQQEQITELIRQLELLREEFNAQNERLIEANAENTQQIVRSDVYPIRQRIAGR